MSSPLFRFKNTNGERYTKLSLPETFNEIRPTPEVEPESSQHTSLTVSSNHTKSVLNEADTRLTALGKDSEENTRTHFLDFFSNQAMSSIKPGSLLLLLIPEPVTAPAIVKHAVNVVHKITQKVNPGQISVITGDQPIYAIGKHLQWKFPT